MGWSALSTTFTVKIIRAAALLLLISLWIPGQPKRAVAAVVFTVNSAVDAVDANPGDGICASAGGTCTLRAAIMEANHSSSSAITIQAPAGNYYLTLSPSLVDGEESGDLNVTRSMTLAGAGIGSTTIDGGLLDRVFNIQGAAPLSVAITDLTIQSGLTRCQALCDSRETGGGINIANPDADVTLARVLVGKNTGGNGGGIYNAGHLTLLDSTISANLAGIGGSGGGIYSAGSLELHGSRVLSNNASAGGGIYSNSASLSTPGSLLIENSLIQNNHHGGIVASTPGSITASTIDANLDDGGIVNFGFTSATTLLIDRSTISNNSANVSVYIPQRGGGITQRGGKIEVVNSTISGNTTNKNGGGIVVEGGQIELDNVTVTGNTADTLAAGAGNGGGIAVASGALSITDSILAGNHSNNPSAPYADCAGTINSPGYNLIGNPAGCTFNDPTTLTGLAPGLGPLQDNGGPTQTHALLSGSPAILAGNPLGCADPNGKMILFDQRGVLRQPGSPCDLGAYSLARRLVLPVIFR